MKITKIETFILHVPVTRGDIADSSHRITHWGAPGVAIHTDSGLVGYGYSGTHAHLPTDRLITDCIETSYGPLLLGQDPTEVRGLWQMLYETSEILWVGRASIPHLALGAIDVALWDLKAKATDQPLWKLLGGSAQKIKAYNTDAGWLNWPLDRLLSDCKRLVETEGYQAVKIKLGSDNPIADLKRVEATRQALGSDVRIMVDINGRWTLPQAIQYGSRLADFDVAWIEEPIRFDDVQGHRRLANTIQTPLALGEQLYSKDHFREFIHADAVHYVQPDVARLAGVTEWWQVAELAYCYCLPVVPHVGDMGQVHIHCCIAHPACDLLEFIPWLVPWMKYPVKIEDGYYQVPDAPGAGSEPSEEALTRMNKI
ncbi:MAG: mandelate racemase/muconate lactonizing enzyme family protein [Opitutales bacterium]|nr:mandelate racemase/muconate lactonizing enzyme family protein [Opitutales bacterium]